MPDIDREKFAYAVAGAMKERGLRGPRDGDRFTKSNGGRVPSSAFSRLGYGRPISAENMLAICHHLALDPMDYLDLKGANPNSRFGDGGAACLRSADGDPQKIVPIKQGVSEGVSRETAIPRGGV